ncbi:4'-phosphopantetheinyl transferase, partial [Pseudomonas syringae pv. tagetis]
DPSARLQLLIDLSRECHAGKKLDCQFSVRGDHLLSLVSVEG